MTCDHCTTPTADGIRLCIDCTIRLERILDEAPDLIHEARTTIARMDRITTGGPATPAAARREAVNVEALDRSREFVQLLTSWARYTLDECARTGAPVHPGLTVSQLLRHNTNTIRHATWADDCLTELARAHRRLHAAVDVPPDSVVIGKCEGVDDDGELCAGTIVADMILVDPDEPEGKKKPANARCKKCRGRFDADAIMSANVERTEGHWTSLNEAIRLARLVPGMPSRATLYRMAERDEFEVRGTEANQLYSAADIVKRLTKMRGTQTAA